MRMGILGVLWLSACAGNVSTNATGGGSSAGGGAAGGTATGGGAGGGGGASGGGSATGGGAMAGGGGSTTQPQPPAATGAPASTLFNGLWTVLDTAHVVPAGSLVPSAAAMPAALSSSTPSMPGLKVALERDAAIFTFDNVANAGDYRAYVVDDAVTFSGSQPRGAVIACAGFRQRTWPSAVVNGHHTRELLQALELPGLKPGAHTVVVEAIASPCPYTGIPGHSDAELVIDSNNGVNQAHLNDPVTYAYVGVSHAEFASFATQSVQYGNVVLNGQGAALDYDARATVPLLGMTLSPGDPVIPADPQVLARSAVNVVLVDPSTLPVVDTGPHALVEDFTDEHVAAFDTMTQNPDYAAYNAFELDPKFQMGNWQFWGRFMQNANLPGVDQPTFAQQMQGTQIFTTLGRLYTGFGDSGEDVGGTLGFASQVAPVLQVDSQTYVHSTFRVNPEATHRRYWWWTLCGGQSADELYDSTAKVYKLRPTVFETSFEPGGNNPSLPDGHTLDSTDLSDDAVGVAKECLSFTEEGRAEDGAATDGHFQTTGTLRAQIHPANKSHGTISLGNEKSDKLIASGVDAYGFRWRVDAQGNHAGPAMPNDQLQPLTRFDLYVRKDRVVAYVDGVQTFCADLTGRPLTMDYAMIVYGDLIYHSSIEWQELSYAPPLTENVQMYQLLMNTPIAAARAWDFISHSDGASLPADFDATLCRAPSDLTVR